MTSLLVKWRWSLHFFLLNHSVINILASASIFISNNHQMNRYINVTRVPFVIGHLISQSTSPMLLCFVLFFLFKHRLTPSGEINSCLSTAGCSASYFHFQMHLIWSESQKLCNLTVRSSQFSTSAGNTDAIQENMSVCLISRSRPRLFAPMQWKTCY